MTEKIKIVIIGYGHIGKKHAEIVALNSSYQLIAIVDPLFSTGELASTSSAPMFDDLQAFWQSGLAVDIFAICTPNGLHYEQAREILTRKKNVIIEKPLTLSASEAKILETLAAENEVHIFPVMQNRFSPPAQWLKQILNDRILGKIFMVQISCYWNRNGLYYTKQSWRGTKKLDGGTLYTQFSHYLDMMYWLFGDITNIKSKFADFNHTELTEFEDSGIVTFDFEKGGMGSFSFSTSVWQENLESSLTIIAENGSVKVGGQYMNTIEKCLIKDYSQPNLPETGLPNDYGTYKGSAQNHHLLYDNISDFLAKGIAMQTTTDDSIQVLQMIENMYASNI